MRRPLLRSVRPWTVNGGVDMQIVIGAAVFAVGSLFGAWLILAGQSSIKKRDIHKTP